MNNRPRLRLQVALVAGTVLVLGAVLGVHAGQVDAAERALGLLGVPAVATRLYHLPPAR